MLARSSQHILTNPSVDRTIAYMKDTIKEMKSLHNKESTFVADGGVLAQVRRAPIGVVLCLGPFNYPMNGMSIRS